MNHNLCHLCPRQGLSSNIKLGYSVPAGFTNLPADAQQRTLSTGKQIFYASYEKKFYDEAVDLCASHGAEIVLPTSQQENLEVRDFLNETRATFGPQVNILGVLLRVVNSGRVNSENFSVQWPFKRVKETKFRGKIFTAFCWGKILFWG